MDTSPSSSESASDSSSSAAASGRSSTVKRVIGFGLAAIVLVGLAIPKISASDEGESTGGRAQQPLGIDAYVVQPTSVQDRLFTTGTLRANESVDLTSEAAGKVTSIEFEEGSRVEQGQLLLTINDAELQAQLKRLEYRLQLAEDRRQRQERLLGEGGVSQETYDQTVNEVNVLESELELVEAQIEKTKVRAPFDGTIGLRYVSEGSYISPQTRIATLQSIDPIKLDLSVPEKYSSRIQAGASISFTVRGSDTRYQGRIYAVEPQIDPNTRSLRLRARAENASRALRPGAFADITVVFGTIDDALTVPAFAVLPELGGQQVFVVEGGQAQPRSVETGVRTDSTVQVTSGLAVGDTVITSGIQQLRPGLPIRVNNIE
jgi:membrane fusion protein (multidrug efflux system)